MLGFPLDDFTNQKHHSDVEIWQIFVDVSFFFGEPCITKGPKLLRFPIGVKGGLLEKGLNRAFIVFFAKSRGHVPSSVPGLYSYGNLDLNPDKISLL